MRSVPKPGRRVGIALPPDRVVYGGCNPFGIRPGFPRSGDKAWQDVSLSYACAARVERATSGFPALYL